MRIAGTCVRAYRLALRAPLRTARGVVRERRGWLLRVTGEDGHAGVGEAAPLPGFGGEPPERAAAALGQASARLVGRELTAGTDVDAVLASLDDALDGAPAARAAVDGALHDLAARAAGLPLAAFLARGPVARSVAVNALLSGDDPASLAREACRAVERGFATLKLKVGAGDPSHDEARVRAVRSAVGPGSRLRLDANGAWREDEALRALERLAPHGIEWVEEPVAGGDVAALARVRSAGPVPVAADESLRDAADAERLLGAGAADAWILKPSWLGGLAMARRLAARARAAGVAVAVTSALDAAVGRTAALHLAAALGGAHAAGLATGDLLARDVACAPAPHRGRIALPPGPGLGLDPDAPAKRAVAAGSG